MLTIKDDKPLETETLEILGHIKTATETLSIPYFMIGAKAIDLWFSHVYGLHPRATRDADFAVGIKSWEEFEGLKNRLIASGNFHKTATVHKLTYRNSIPIDLVAFGGVENPQGSVAWPPDHAQVMNVTGFQDINAAVEEVKLVPDGLIVRVASIPGIMLSKLLAWIDRRETRDAWDVAFLLYFYERTLTEDRLFHDVDLVKSVGETAFIGSVLLGRDIATLTSPKTLEALQKLLQKDTEKEQLVRQFSIPSAMSWVDDDPSPTANKLFDCFLDGLFNRR